MNTRSILLPAATMLALLGGCASYVNYPAIGKDDAAVNNPNIAPTPEVTAVALRWVVERYPVGGPFVVNLPRGTDRSTAQRILSQLRNPDARLVTPETKQLPAFHVSMVWIRGEKATVEVIRPVTDPQLTKPNTAYTSSGVPVPSTPTTGPVYQAFNIKLESRWSPWVVTHAQGWPIGTAKPPELMGWASAVPGSTPPPAAAPTAEPATQTPAAPASSDASGTIDLGEDK